MIGQIIAVIVFIIFFVKGKKTVASRIGFALLGALSFYLPATGLTYVVAEIAMDVSHEVLIGLLGLCILAGVVVARIVYSFDSESSSSHNGRDKYCVVCDRDCGPLISSHCTPDSLVSTTLQGFVRKRRRFFDSEGRELSADDLSSLRKREKAISESILAERKQSRGTTPSPPQSSTIPGCESTDSASLDEKGYGGGASPQLMERDNVGTRCDTEDRGNTYFATLFQKDPEPVVFYFFDTKEGAMEALSEVSCMAVAKDSGRLICTEILTFGVFPAVDRDDSRTWGALLAGKSLTHDLWSEARECFKRHGGRMRREDEPPKTTPQQQTSTGRPKTGNASAVIFVRDIDLAKQGGGGTKKIYKARDKESAVEFPKSQDTSRPYFYIEIETPSGWVGKDKDGIYEF